MTAPSPIPGYSKAPQGLFVLPRVARVFTGTAISPSPPSRQWPSRSTIHAGRNLPDKGLRYLRQFVTLSLLNKSLPPLRGKVRMGELPLTLVLSHKRRGALSSATKGAGHFCRPLHVAIQIGPYLPPRSDRGSGVWSLRIPPGSSPSQLDSGWRFTLAVFPADCPHRTHCHQLAQIRPTGSAGYSDFPAYSQILKRP